MNSFEIILISITSISLILISIKIINDEIYYKLYQKENDTYWKLDNILTRYICGKMLNVKNNHEEYIIFNKLHMEHMKNKRLLYKWRSAKERYLYYKELNKKTVYLFNDFFPEIKSINRNIKINNLL